MHELPQTHTGEGDLTQMQQNLPEEEEDNGENYYCLPVEERNLLWNAAREHKLESIRQMADEPGLEECTFKPQLVTNRTTRRSQRTNKDN